MCCVTKICVVVTGYVLCYKDMCYDNDMCCVTKVCVVVTGYMLCYKVMCYDMYCVTKICVVTRYVLLQRYVLW